MGILVRLVFLGGLIASAGRIVFPGEEFFPGVVYAQVPEEEAYYEELKKEYVPQPTPGESFQLELKLMKDGMYCYNLPLFDPQWRQKGHRILTNPDFAGSAKVYSQPFAVSVQGQYAVVYFPQHKNLGPVFLYKDPLGWIIDRSMTADKIFYDEKSRWIIVGGDYPYLSILHQIYDLKKVKMDEEGIIGYQIKEEISEINKGLSAPEGAASKKEKANVP